MIEIMRVLVNYGMDFEYENFGSKGETLTSHELGLTVSFQNNFIYINHCGDSHKLENTPTKLKMVPSMVEKYCIDETSSF